MAGAEFPLEGQDRVAAYAALKLLGKTAHQSLYEAYKVLKDALGEPSGSTGGDFIQKIKVTHQQTATQETTFPPA